MYERQVRNRDDRDGGARQPRRPLQEHSGDRSSATGDHLLLLGFM
jgi:hypothetical protein